MRERLIAPARHETPKSNGSHRSVAKRPASWRACATDAHVAEAGAGDPDVAKADATDAAAAQADVAETPNHVTQQATP